MPLSLAFGEILFDCFEDRVCLGGAPLNFAWNLRQFGFPVAMASAVGRDTLGGDARRFMAQADIDQRWVTDRDEPTGTVDIRLVGGEPAYVFAANVAWDNIEAPRETVPPPLLYFGTLAQRSAHNRTALRRLLALQVRRRFFDVNLRQDFYSEAVIVEGLRNATIVKCNAEEWEVIRRFTRLETPERLMEAFGLDALALTHGGDEAALYTRTGAYRAKPPVVSVVDTVGAGDAFSAALAASLIRGMAPAKTLAAACAAGAAVVQQPGAHITLPDGAVEAVSG